MKNSFTFVESPSAAFSNTLSTLFDGVDEFGNMGQTTALEFTSDFAISVWVKFTNVGKNEFIVDTCTDQSAGDGYQMRLTSGNVIRWWSFKASSSQFVDSTTTFSAGSWHHLVGVRDFTAKRNRLYVDGSLEASSTGDIDLSTSDTTNLRVAFSVVFNGLEMDGNIDELTWWSTLLNATDVTNLYNSGTPNDPTTHAKAASLTEYHRMGDGDTFPTVTGQKSVRDITLTNMESGDFVTDTPP